MGLSTPSTTCDSTAPTATSEASVSNMYGTPGTGKANAVVSKSACFRQQKARSASSVHLNSVFFLDNVKCGRQLTRNYAQTYGNNLRARSMRELRVGNVGSESRVAFNMSGTGSTHDQGTQCHA